MNGKKNKSQWSNKKNRSSNRRDSNDSRSDRGAYSNRDNRDQGIDTNARGGNDPSWHVVDPAVVNSVANISYQTAIGVPFDLGEFSAASQLRQKTVPGICVISYRNTPGYSDSINSAVNLASVNAYAYTRALNSGAKNYDPVDEIMVILGVSDLHISLEELFRIYGIMNTYSATNYYLPRALVHALGYDFDDLQKNFAAFRGYLQQMAVNIEGLSIPSNIKYLLQQQQLAREVYVDDPIAKAQIYAFKRTGYYKYVERSSDSSTPSYLQWVDRGSGLRGYEDIVAWFNTQVDALRLSQDVGIILGDIRKAWGSDLFHTRIIDPMYSVVPVYNLEILTMIQNSTAHGPLLASGVGIDDIHKPSPDIRQYFSAEDTTSFLVYTPYVSDSGGFDYSAWLNPLVTMPTDATSPELNMLATRFISKTSRRNAFSNTITLLDVMPAVYVEMYSMFFFNANHEIDSTSHYSMEFGSGLDQEALLDVFADWNAFNMHPTIYVGVDNSGVKSITNLFCDFTNYAVFGPDVLDNMHRADMLALFAIPKADFNLGGIKK